MERINLFSDMGSELGMTLIRWKSSEKSNGTFEVDMVRRYEMGLKTWVDWLETHVNRTKTKLFFVSLSPAHLRYVFCYSHINFDGNHYAEKQGNIKAKTLGITKC